MLGFELKESAWTADEIALLRKNYPRTGTGPLCKLLPNRTPASIREKAKSLGLLIIEGKWTQEEIELILKHYPVNGTKKLRKLLPHRKIESIYRKAKRLKCHTEQRAAILQSKAKAVLPKEAVSQQPVKVSPAPAIKAKSDVFITEEDRRWMDKHKARYEARQEARYEEQRRVLLRTQLKNERKV